MVVGGSRVEAAEGQKQQWGHEGSTWQLRVRSQQYYVSRIREGIVLERYISRIPGDARGTDGHLALFVIMLFERVK